MTPVYVSDHAGRALARLVQQLKEKPKLAAWINTYLVQIQFLEDVIFQILGGRDLNTATGWQLHLLGKLVGQPFGGEPEAVYRRLIRGRIRANRSHGTPEDLYAVLRAILGDDAISTEYTPRHPAAFEMSVFANITAGEAQVLAKFIQVARLAGVGAELFWFPQELDDTFTIAGAWTRITSAASPGNTSITVADTSDFPATGSIIIDEGLATEETRSYTGKTGTTFTGLAGLTSAHTTQAGVRLIEANDATQCLSDVTQAAGGKLASVISA